jgi:glycosyltransferase involved in cell wall biosynthesis
MLSGKLRLAIVVSHPIQHFCPQYVSFAQNKDVEIKVFFGSALGYKEYVDVNFGKGIRWSNLQLDRFDHCFLNGDQVLQPDKNLDAPTLEAELTKYQPQVIFTYGYFQRLQRRARRWSLNNEVEIAYISDSELRHKRNKLKELFKGIFIRNYFLPIRYFLSMGDANEAYYKNYGVPLNRIIRMHYPIDFVQYKSSYLNRDMLNKKIRKQFQIAENEIVILVVGKLVEWKNQDHVIEAMKILEAEGVGLTLFIIGSGKMKDDWEQKANALRKSKVIFTGFVSIDDLPAYYAAGDIYIHPASLEPHSVAISEAILMGCPVILSDHCGSYGPADDVQEGKNGFVYPFGNIKMLAEKIKLLVQDEAMRKEFGNYSHVLGMTFQERSHYGMMNELIKRYKESAAEK